MAGSGASWTGRQLYWDFTPAHLAAIDQLMARIEEAGLPFHEIRPASFLASRARRRSRRAAGAPQRAVPASSSCAASRSTDTIPNGCRPSIGASARISDMAARRARMATISAMLPMSKRPSRGYTTSRELNLHTDFGRDRRAVMRARTPRKAGSASMQFAEGARDPSRASTRSICRCWSAAFAATAAARRRRKTSRSRPIACRCSRPRTAS